jgi:solute carrier family 25 citrate transporter 1
MADPLDIPKYRNAAHALYTVLKEEGPGALYRGVSLTALRQGSNQAVNFTAYTEFKELLQKWQPQYADSPIPSYQTTLIGLVSGAMGPLSNAPIDTIKTRLQKQPAQYGETALSRITAIARDMFRYVKEVLDEFIESFTRFIRVSRPVLCVLLPVKRSRSRCMSF